MKKSNENQRNIFTQFIDVLERVDTTTGSKSPLAREEELLFLKEGVKDVEKENANKSVEEQRAALKDYLNQVEGLIKNNPATLTIVKEAMQEVGFEQKSGRGNKRV